MILFPSSCYFWLLYLCSFVCVLSDALHVLISTQVQITLLLLISVLSFFPSITSACGSASSLCHSCHFFPSGAKLLTAIIIWSSFYFLGTSGMLLVSKDLEVVLLPPPVPTRLQNFVPVFINTASSMILSVETVTSNNIHSEN